MRASQIQPSPRRLPQQERALLTVDCILTAARIILEQKGYDAATTNNVAELAGVSIGSLYQYFAGKEAIFAALVEDTIIKAGDRTRDLLIECMHMPLTAAIHAIVRHMVDIRREYGFVLRQLPREMPRFHTITGHLTVEKYLVNATSAFYAAHREEIRVNNLSSAGFVVQHLLINTIDSFLDNTNLEMSEDVLVHQLCDAAIKYLTK